MLRNVKDNQTWIFLTNLHNFTLVIYYRKDQLPVYDEICSFCYIKACNNKSYSLSSNHHLIFTFFTASRLRRQSSKERDYQCGE